MTSAITKVKTETITVRILNQTDDLYVGLIESENKTILIKSTRKLGIQQIYTLDGRYDKKNVFEALPVINKNKNKIEIKDESIVHEGAIEPNEPTNSLATISNDAPKLAPLPSLAQIDEFIERYDYVKKKIIKQSDMHKIGDKPYIKKSGWRKFINAFGLSIELIKQETVYEADEWVSQVIVRAHAPNGQYSDGVGVCEQNEKGFAKKKHDVVATAYTRAVNRAVSDLVAFGEVSYEELNK